MRQRLQQLGAEAIGNSPEDSEVLIRNENVNWASIIKASRGKGGQFRQGGIADNPAHARSLVSYHSRVDRSGEEFGFMQVSRFCAVAQS